MKLSEYLSEQKITDSAFARAIETAPSTVMRLKKGDRLPSMTLAQRIMEATGGAVRPDDFLPTREATA
jgi:DNA-binding XRE family transcriptional regulator